jgi:hypothetical protein
MHLVEPAYGTFTKQELARLAVYRAAVAAGFYTDWDGSRETTDVEALGWLASDTVSSGEGYPFTAAELERLERCRAAVAAGYYTE